MSGKRIYVAGPLFSEHERKFLEDLVGNIATKLGLDEKKNFFLPHRDAGDIGITGTGREKVFEEDLHQLENSDVVIALLDGPDIDSGTAAELGIAYAKRKKIFAILTDWRRWDSASLGVINNMIWGICGKGTRIYRNLDHNFLENLKRALKD